MSGKRWQEELMQFLRNGASVDQKNRNPLSKAAFRQVRQLSSNEAAPEASASAGSRARRRSGRMPLMKKNSARKKKEWKSKKNESAGESGIF